MKLKDVIVVLALITALVVIWFFLNERNRSQRLELIISKLRKENRELKSAYLKLFEGYLRKTEGVEPSILSELKQLKETVDNLDRGTHIELTSVIKRVNDNEGTKAVKDLAKIVETKLKEKALKDANFNKKPTLHNLLEHAKACMWIPSRTYENGLLLKEIRNKESHELAVEYPRHQIGIAIFTGIEILYSLN